MKAQVADKWKNQLFVCNRYGDVDPTKALIFGVTAEDETKHQFETKNSQIETTHLIRKMDSNVTTLFNF